MSGSTSFFGQMEMPRQISNIESREQNGGGGGTYTCNATCYDRAAQRGATAMQARGCCTGVGGGNSLPNNRPQFNKPIGIGPGSGFQPIFQQQQNPDAFQNTIGLR